MRRNSKYLSDTFAFFTGTALIASSLFFGSNPTIAATCGLGSNVTFSSISGGRCQAVITSGTTFTVPRDWSNSNNTIEAIGPGGKGASRNSIVSASAGGGGGGGAYAAITNLTLSRGSSVSYSIGGANSGNATYFNGPNSGSASVSAAAGANGATGTAGLAGGLASNSIGTTKFDGGSGANQGAGTGGGGGGAGGPSGAGTTGSSGTGGTGDNGSGGAGGTTTSTDGNPGSPGTEWTTAGSGGGGAGGAPSGGWNGGDGGNYGAGGGGGGGGNAVDPGGIGGNGKSGVIVVTYTPGAVSLSKPVNNLGLVGYWPFNDATSTTAGDFSGNGNTGTLSGSSLPIWVSGKRGSALSFDGATSNVSTADINQTEGIQKMTIAFWIKPSSFQDYQQYIDKFNGTNGWSLGAGGFGDDPYTSNKEIVFYPDAANSNRAGVTSPVLTAGQWSHVVVVYDSTLSDVGGASVKIFINGVSQSVTVSGTISGGTTGSNASPVTIAQEPPPGAGDPNFAGVMDDVRIYNRALSASEVAALYGDGSNATRFGSSADLTRGSTLANGLVGLWTFDGKDMTWRSLTTGVAYDRSNNGNTGTLTNMNANTARVPGKLGQALSFDGSASYVSIPSSASLGNAMFTISAWVYIPGSITAGWQTIFERNRGGTSDSGLWKSNNGSFFACEADNGTARDFATTISPNTWYHVMCTHDAGGTTVLYLNGVQDGSFSDGVGATQSGAASIGANPTPGEYFPGYIDEVRVYNRALSANEAKQLYLLGQSKLKY